MFWYRKNHYIKPLANRLNQVWTAGTHWFDHQQQKSHAVFNWLYCANTYRGFHTRSSQHHSPSTGESSPFINVGRRCALTWCVCKGTRSTCTMRITIQFQQRSQLLDIILVSDIDTDPSKNPSSFRKYVARSLTSNWSKVSLKVCVSNLQILL